MTAEYSAATDKGRRKHNRDAFAAGGTVSSPAVKHKITAGKSGENGFAVFAVCDGVGDRESSADAAETAAGYIALKAETGPFPKNAEEAYKWIKQTLIETKNAVFDRQSEKKAAYEKSFFKKLLSSVTGGRKGTYDVKGSSTVSVLTVFPGGFLFANCGDSPCFALRGGVLTELSVRHNAAGTDIQFSGERPAESVLMHDLKEAPRDVPVFISATAGNMTEDTVFLICSDGVTSAIGEDTLAGMLENGATAEEITALAVSSGSTDNCTAVTVKINM